MVDPPSENSKQDDLLIEDPNKNSLGSRIKNIPRRKIILVLVVSAIALSIFFAVSRRAVYSEVPDLDKMSFQDLQKLAQSKLENRVSWVSIKEIPKEVRFAIIYSEDASFFQHEGIDFDAISQSIQENIKRKKYAFGASTITQQVVKNVFLTKEKTLTRKFREMILAKRIEERFNKSQILEVYFNIVELGPKLYGLNAASRRYFGKTVSELNAAEGAFFAILLPSPKKRYSSIFLKGEIPKVFRTQVRRILKDLEGTQVITADQHAEYRNYDYFYVRRQEPDWKGPKDFALPDSDADEDSHFSIEEEEVENSENLDSSPSVQDPKSKESDGALETEAAPPVGEQTVDADE